MPDIKKLAKKLLSGRNSNNRSPASASPALVALPTVPKDGQDVYLTLSEPTRHIELPGESPDPPATPDEGHLSPRKIAPWTSPRSEPALSRQVSSSTLHESISRLESSSNLGLAQSSAQHNTRPWHNSPGKKHLWFVPMEQTTMHDETRNRVAQAISCTLDLTGDAVHAALFAGVELMRYAPIPGLEAAGMALLQIWDAVQQVTYNRMRCLRLAMRSADSLISIREEIAQLNDVVGKQLEVPLRRFEKTLISILYTLQQQTNLSGFERYLKREQLTESIENCTVALDDCLMSFNLSTMLRIAESTMVRKQSYNQPLLLMASEEPTLLDELDVPFTDEPEADVIEAWKRLNEEDNKTDALQDGRDYRASLEHAVNTRDETVVIRLLQVGHSEFPKTLIVLLKDAFSTLRKKDEERALHRAGGRLLRSQTYPIDHPGPTGGKNPRRQPTIDSTESILHMLDASRRESRGHPSVVRSWDIARDDVRLGDVIGRGHFSTVYKGIWRGRTVAVKVLNPATASKEEFRNELTLYGSSSFSGDLSRMLVGPYMRHGSLSDYLKRCEWDAAGEKPALFLRRGPYDVDYLKFMHQIARGMEFIHENGILHGDLRAANVLVNDRLKCVIADFGCSKFITQVTYEDPFPTHALRWQAPEIMGRRSLRSTQADVYAYAMTCVEIVSWGNIPWPTLSDDLIKEEVLRKKARPPISSQVQELKIQPLIQACWGDAPASRPSFKDIATSLQNLRYPQVEK
ncbi:Protein kinase-like domain containing protein [Amanita muscaria]